MNEKLLEELLKAIRENNQEFLQKKIIANSSINLNRLHTPEGDSLVQYAVKCNSEQSFEALKYLVESHAINVNLSNKEGTENAFDSLNKDTDQRIVDLLNDNAGTIEKQLLYAVQQENTGVVKKILERNPDICKNNTNADIDKSENIPAISLQVATFRGNKEICELLLEAGADSKGGGQHGSAAEIAERKGNDKMKKLFQGYSEKSNPNNAPAKPITIIPLQEKKPSKYAVKLATKLQRHCTRTVI